MHIIVHFDTNTQHHHTYVVVEIPAVKWNNFMNVN